MAKNIRGFWRIYLSITFWILLWMLTSLMIWNLNVTVITTLKYCYKKALNKNLQLIERAMKYFPKKLLAHEICSSIVVWATKFFEKFVKPLPLLPLSPTYLKYAPQANFKLHSFVSVKFFPSSRDWQFGTWQVHFL